MTLRSQKHSPRIALLVIILVSILVILPQLSSTSAVRQAQEDKYAKSLLSVQGGAKEIEPAENSELTTITIDPGFGKPKKSALRQPNAIQAVVGQINEAEPNNTSATATPIANASAKVRGNVFPVNDVDFYSFTATMGDRIYAATQTLFDASASGDSVLELLGTDGTTVLETDNNDGTFNASSSTIAGFLIPSTGTFFLRVRHNVATGSIRPYDLNFTRQTGSPTAEVESNNTPATANPLPASGWVSGTITAVSPGEADFFSVTLAAGDSVYLSLDMNPERDAAVWNGRLGFALFGNPPANQILLANDANAGAAPADPNSEAFFFTVKDAGTYFVYVDSIVAAGLGANATYNLSVAVFSQAPGGNCTTYTSTNVPVAIPTGPGMVTSTITVPGNPRIEDITVQINLNHTFMQDLDVHLVSPAGNDNGLFTDIGAATVGGPQTLMDIVIDDDAALPPAFALSSSFHIQPELAYRLGWFKGEDAGGTWTLVIRDDATGDGGTLNSWSITICEPSAAPACDVGFEEFTVFSTDFESGDAGFTHSGVQDEWELGLPTFAPITTANSGVNCWKTDLDNSYNASSNQDLVSPAIDLTGLTGPIRANWAMRYHIESANFDHFFVEAREVGNPSNAVRLFDWLDATMNNTVGNPAVTIAESAGWGLHSGDISALAGLNIEIRFHFDSDTTVQLAGVAIDDVSVTACQEAPCMLTCPANVTQSNDPNQCGAVVNYPPPTTSGGCATITCSPPSGSFFPVGTTTVTCTDTGGATCSFTVTVNDTEPPAITCPANLTVNNATDQCSAVVNFDVTATDNCTAVTVVATPPSGSTFPVGTTTVNATATDTAGNTAMCSFTVTVADAQPPSITCPPNVTATPPMGSTSVTVTFADPTSSDNCPGVTAVCVPPSGSSFPVGISTVTCTATDASGNTATCSFSVTTFNFAIADPGNPTAQLLVDTSGNYVFCCGGTTVCGQGTVRRKGNILTIEHNTPTYRVLIKIDISSGKADATLKLPPGQVLCQIIDRAMNDGAVGTCSSAGCAPAPQASARIKKK